MITLKVMLICSLMVAIRCEDPAEKKDQPTDPPKITTTTTTTTEKQKMDDPSSTTQSTTTTTTVAPTPTAPAAVPPAPAAVPPAVTNQVYPPFGFYPGFYPGFAPPQLLPSLGVRLNLDSATPEVLQDPLKPVQSFAGVFPIRQNPFPNNPFLNSLPGRGVSAYSGTFSG